MWKLLLTSLLIIVNLSLAQKRVACLGNSIVLSNWDSIALTYPERLQMMLGDGYEVRNFGRGGSTVLQMGKYPYRFTDQYWQSIIFDPNIVIIMLGSNDTGAGFWDNRHLFAEHYKLIAESYPKAKVYLAFPPHHLKPLNDERIHHYIEIIKTLGYKTINTHTGIQWDSQDFSDSVHLTDRGLQKIASKVYYKLKPVTLGTVPEPPVDGVEEEAVGSGCSLRII